jgi:hypothetical protein
MACTPSVQTTYTRKNHHKQTMGMSHFGLTIYIKKYFKAKEEEL